MPSLVELFMQHGSGVRCKLYHYPEFVIAGYYPPQHPFGTYRTGSFEIRYDGDNEMDRGWIVIPDIHNKDYKRVV